MKNILLLLIFSFTVAVVAAQTNQSSVNQVVNSSVRIENVVVYPNPAVDVLKVSIRSSGKSNAEISLFNNIGKQVYTQKVEIEAGTNIFPVDIQNKAIDPGIYFVQVIAEKESFTRKLIVK